jgi:hypothetical protein
LPVKSGFVSFEKKVGIDMRKSISTKRVAIVIAVLFLIFWLIGLYWSMAPDAYDVKKRVAQQAQNINPEDVAGYTLTATMIDVSETLLDKPGGNDSRPCAFYA